MHSYLYGEWLLIHSYTRIDVDTMSPEPTRLLILLKPQPPKVPDFVSETMLWELGRLSCLELATEPSPHSADGSSAAAIQPGELTATGRRRAPLDGVF